MIRAIASKMPPTSLSLIPVSWNKNSSQAFVVELTFGAQSLIKLLSPTMGKMCENLSQSEAFDNDDGK